MSTYLIGSTPVLGHVTPMLEIARHLACGGNRVIVLTGSRFGDRIRGAGLEFRPLSGVADFDDRQLDKVLPERDKYRGFAQIQYDIQSIFVRPIPDQYAAVKQIVDAEKPDAILVDSAFIGAAPILLDSRASRPAIIGIGVVPLSQSSRDLAPNTSFVGPVLAPLPDVQLPEWWGELDGSRPVVHVTQGTIDNKDLTRLIRPTIDGLADTGVLVVVSTGGRPVADVGEVPANVRIVR